MESSDTMESIGTKSSARSEGAGRPEVRVAALVALVIATGVALRGRLPDEHRVPRDRAPDSPASAVGVVTMLTVSLLVIGIALVASARRPKVVGPAIGHQLPAGTADGSGNWRLRLIIIGIGLVVSWVVAYLLISEFQLENHLRQDVQPPPLPDDTGPAQAPPPPSQVRVGRDALNYLIGASVLMVVMMVASGVASALRRPRPQAEGTMVEARPRHDPVPEPLAVAAERGLAEVGDLSREPREAIIACYAAMEAALAEAPGAAPQVSDTPTEVLARAVGTSALSSGNAATLVDLFTEARFSRHVMTEDHRDTAERALRSVLDELRSSV